MPDLKLPYFLATPESGDGLPGVVVIHEGNGISSQLLRWCQKLASQGYVVVAPDLYFRSGGTEAADPMTLNRALDFKQVQLDLLEAAGIARANGAKKMGVTGFCMGGRLTYRAALAGGFDAAVGFYGSGIAGELGEPKCPTLLFFGGKDEWIPASDITTVAGHHADTFIYPEAGHGFMRDGTPDYVPAAAEDAWVKLLAHFRTNLA